MTRAPRESILHAHRVDSVACVSDDGTEQIESADLTTALGGGTIVVSLTGGHGIGTAATLARVAVAAQRAAVQRIADEFRQSALVTGPGPRPGVEQAITLAPIADATVTMTEPERTAHRTPAEAKVEEKARGLGSNLAEAAAIGLTLIAAAGPEAAATIASQAAKHFTAGGLYPR